jgi:hypothetical protein
MSPRDPLARWSYTPGVGGLPWASEHVKLQNGARLTYAREIWLDKGQRSRSPDPAKWLYCLKSRGLGSVAPAPLREGFLAFSGGFSVVFGDFSTYGNGALVPLRP